MTSGVLGVKTISLPPTPPIGWSEVQVTPQLVVMVASPRYSTTSPWSVHGNPLLATQSRANRKRFTVTLGGETVIGPPPTSTRIRFRPRTGSPGTRKGTKQFSPPGQSLSSKQPWLVVVEHEPCWKIAKYA